MPKKDKKLEKDKEIEEDSEEEQEEEESELIEDLFEAEQETQFISPFRFTSSSTPILGKITEAPEIITLERGVANAPILSDDEEPLKYGISGEEKNEPKYNSNSPSQTRQPGRINFERVGRGRDELGTVAHINQGFESFNNQDFLHMCFLLYPFFAYF